MKAGRLLLPVLAAVAFSLVTAPTALAMREAASAVWADSIERDACWYLENHPANPDGLADHFSCDYLLSLIQMPLEVRMLLLDEQEQTTVPDWLRLLPEIELPPESNPKSKPAAEPKKAQTEQAKPARSYSYSGSVEQWAGLVAKYFAPGDVAKALRVIDCETIGTGDPNTVNKQGSGASGLFQHMPKYWAERSAAAGWAGASIFDPEANIAVAAWLLYSVNGGWGHWPNCGR